MNSESTHGYRPCIIIPGIGQSKVIETDENGEKLRNLWPFDPDVDALVKKITPSGIRMMLLRRDCGFSSALDEAVRSMLEPLGCTPDSERKVRAEVVGYYRPVGECTDDEKRYIYKMVPLSALADIIGEENLYFFAYDIFGKADENARLLREFISTVKEQRQCDKVDLIPVSMGATVAQMYFELYGGDRDVKRVIGVVPAYDGSDIAADLLAGDIRTDDCGALLEMLLSRREAEKISKLMSKMPKKVADRAVRTLVRAACETVIVNSSTMWGIIPSERYTELRDRYLADPDHDSLRAVADRHWRVRRNIKELVRREQERSVEFYNICGCGKPLTPIAASDNLMSDTIVPTYSSSMGAQCAAPGKTLSPGRDEPADFVSPHSDINAACAAVPDRTWFYYNMEHEQAAENTALLELVAAIASSDEPIDVFTLPDHPQFVDYC